jgi:predicted transcriptional regulator
MARPSAIVTDAELSVLNHLWEHGPSVVREIAYALYSQNTPAYHATVNSLLDQL